MANITISNLQLAELEYEELSDLELEVVAGGREKERHVEVGYSQHEGIHASVGFTF